MSVTKKYVLLLTYYKCLKMRGFTKFILLVFAIVLVGCAKNTDDYQPPTKGNVPSTYFIESEWKVMENTIVIPDEYDDFCMRNVSKIYFGVQTCIITAIQSQGNYSENRKFKGAYRVENVGGNTTYLHLDNMVHGEDTCSYVLKFDEINTSRSSISLVVDLLSGNHFPQGNYGSFRLSK